MRAISGPASALRRWVSESRARSTARQSRCVKGLHVCAARGKGQCSTLPTGPYPSRRWKHDSDCLMVPCHQHCPLGRPTTCGAPQVLPASVHRAMWTHPRCPPATCGAIPPRARCLTELALSRGAARFLHGVTLTPAVDSIHVRLELPHRDYVPLMLNIAARR